MEGMELHPILEKTTSPNTGLWYVLSALGNCPSMRVGLSASFIEGTDDHPGKIYIVGGANPSGPFNETYVLDFDTFSWDMLEAEGFKARYEHSAWTPTFNQNAIYVFGGAHQTGNLNDIQVLDTLSSKWLTETCSGSPPGGRTLKTTACVGDKFIVYSGGQSAADPVTDRQVHIYDSSKSQWTTPSVKGDPPKPRHGHVMVAIGNRVYIHGGMSGQSFYNDLHVFDLDKNAWLSIKQKKTAPSMRAAHGGVGVDTHMYIFGGMNKDGALDDMHMLDTKSFQWTSIELQGPPPACRLDFGMCKMSLKVPIATSRSNGDSATAQNQADGVLTSQFEDLHVSNSGDQETISDETTEQATSSATDGATAAAAVETRDFIFIIGGMDTEGNIFDDCLVYMIPK
ncbi:unnamed protein product [Owenia fusiformis]|uniref:Rab9 effector protein with kelch motifs n=1 Tax=Owenia fusiformis TaxID=6347 RepID=A0A8J1UZS4_OWEFU|nr:unnamed protein product [Owenia fusiformis]